MQPELETYLWLALWATVNLWRVQTLPSIIFYFSFHSGKYKGSMSVNYTDLWAESGPLPVCINKTLMEHTVFFLWDAIYGCLPVSSAVSDSLNYLLLDHLKEHLSNFCLKYGHMKITALFYLVKILKRENTINFTWQDLLPHFGAKVWKGHSWFYWCLHTGLYSKQNGSLERSNGWIKAVQLKNRKMRTTT